MKSIERKRRMALRNRINNNRKIDRLHISIIRQLYYIFPEQEDLDIGSYLGKTLKGLDEHVCC